MFLSFYFKHIKQILNAYQYILLEKTNKHLYKFCLSCSTGQPQLKMDQDGF